MCKMVNGVLFNDTEEVKQLKKELEKERLRNQMLMRIVAENNKKLKQYEDEVFF